MFELVNGHRSTREIAKNSGRSLVAVDHDIGKLNDFELIREKKDSGGKVVKKGGSTVYEKTPLIKHVPMSYFNDVANTAKLAKKSPALRGKPSRAASIHVPSDKEILDLSKQGEDQVCEFKAPGTGADKITKEIAGFLHTRAGGIIFYGIGDDGSILGSDMRRQDFDQKIQNSVRNTIYPPPTIEIRERKVMGATVLLVVVPPWDRKTIYQNTMDNRYYIRHGTNVFAVRPDELKKLHSGESIA